MNWILALFGIGLFLIGVKLLARLTPNLISVTKGDQISWKDLIASFSLGIFLTALTQSSSAVGVIVLVLLDKRVVTFKQTGFFLAGSNIGTTISGQIFTLPIEKLIIPMFIISLVGFLLGYRFWIMQKVSKFLFALSIIFTGLQIISSVTLYYRDSLVTVFEYFSSIFQAFLIGIILTAISQSSSLIIGILIVLSGKHIIAPAYATAAVMGLNVGTSTTLMIASLGLSKHGKLGAVFQVVYNSICALLVFGFFPCFLQIVELISRTPHQFVANSHTFFNLVAGILLVLGWKYIESICYWIVYR
ncbi:Na/Pi symporter [Natranaerobius thermophilus]|uniref:Na/Pi-cotransporter family protein/PhoU family protein n=1 Tax=Natranaerobius thermophilus (strain ATCC BAA-1301 / DSM 18059 / JW/NM-WN-LF) TaxID=457570 RepID=B2A3B7_NATTJ|nr:Na/Pi symporter [Natranaerobius thermophilus]ACB85047.1 Na/Pi-cotransporter family protein/PhoU family protein [Natranaerobius thermophilus JW/NM-WN-LF]